MGQQDARFRCWFAWLMMIMWVTGAGCKSEPPEVIPAVDPCPSSAGCFTEGLCRSRYKRCVATMASHCESSQACRDEGRCLYFDQRCWTPVALKREEKRRKMKRILEGAYQETLRELTGRGHVFGPKGAARQPAP